MDLMLKISEQVEEQWAKAEQQEQDAEQQQKGGGEKDAAYRSVYTINGNPILAPLMTDERRLEMQELRQAAMAVEQQLGKGLKKIHNKVKSRQRGLYNAGRQSVDASTSMDSIPPPQPLTVLGRFKQQLHFSETLIYDNNLNAIIKSKKESKIMHLVLEEWPGRSAQYAVIIEQAPKFGLMVVQERSELEMEKPEEMNVNIQAEEAAIETSLAEKTPESSKHPEDSAPKKDLSIQDLIEVAKTLKENMVNNERELRRSSTSPFLSPNTEKGSAGKDVSTYCYEERLHPTLWKRYHSYPFGSKPSDSVSPTSPSQSSGLPIHIPMVAPPPSPVSNLSSKIQVKQRMSPEETKLKSKVLTGSQQKLTGNKLASNKKMTRAASSVSYAAHATSHAKVEGGNTDGNPKISSTQRRLSYDPRATLKRSTSTKKAATIGSSPSQTAVTAVLSPGVNADQLKHRLLDEMEQQQRQRFHQLVSQQAEEQQRLQEEFRAQQQLLMDQMLCDMSNFADEKYEEVDQADSESSSVTSLPQSRLELEPNEEPKSGV